LLIVGSYERIEEVKNSEETKMKLSICCGAEEHEFAKGFCSKCHGATGFEDGSEAKKAMVEIVHAMVEVAKAEADKERTRLGRELTDAEVRRVAEDVERISKTFMSTSAW